MKITIEDGNIFAIKTKSDTIFHEMEEEGECVKNKYFEGDTGKAPYGVAVFSSANKSFTKLVLTCSRVPEFDSYD